VIDEVIPEPAGGAHSDWECTAEAVRHALLHHVRELRALPLQQLQRARADKYFAMGEWQTAR
jgi:acetyl-CoA carboxylase carboxyl transferase subunit alpha